MKRMLFTWCIFLLIGITSGFPQGIANSIDAKKISYDVILVAGQSNTHYGYSLNPIKDTVNSKVYSLYRHNGKDYQIDLAKPVLDFWTRKTNRNSFAITFANLYATNMENSVERRVLIIPCGYAGSSIVSWSKNQKLYNDAIKRVNYVLDNNPGSKLVAVLWHQGEANVGWGPYQSRLDQMIDDMRKDIKQKNMQNVPFILGGMVPNWVNKNYKRRAQQEIIKNTPSRVINTGYADSEFPTVISKPNNSFDNIHFDADGQREMGKRYFNTYLQMVNNSTQQFVTSESKEEVSTEDSNINTSELILYPNPIDNELNIESTIGIKHIEIYNLSNLVFTNKYNNKQSIKIQTHTLKPGIYTVVVTFGNDKVETNKIIKK